MTGPLILDGKVLADEISTDLKKRIEIIISKTGRKPALATIIAGENPASVMYVRMKGGACRRVGMDSRRIALPGNVTTDEILHVINELNNDGSIHGILLQHPVPPQIDEQKCFNFIAPEKDVDGVNVASFGAASMNLDSFIGATPLAIMSILKRYGIETAGKDAVVVGRSPILGKPAAMLLLNADATVTICHSKTKNLPDKIKSADIVVAAVGRPKFVKADWIKEGAVIIDAGYNEGNVGDVDLENAAAKSSAYTPVPGGVGPVTIIKLIEQTVTSAEKNISGP